MITEDYVNSEIAKLLKEKGFEEECNKSYGINGTLYSNFPKDCILAPTLQMAMKWLREVHKIDISSNPCQEDSDHFYEFYLYKNGIKIVTITNWLYSKYEQACEAAIKYCLENLI